MPTNRLGGVFAPVLTPMFDDLTPDTPKWIAFCKQLLADGCTGLAPFGTTSEANSLGLSERMEMLDALIEAKGRGHALQLIPDVSKKKSSE